MLDSPQTTVALRSPIPTTFQQAFDGVGSQVVGRPLEKHVAFAEPEPEGDVQRLDGLSATGESTTFSSTGNDAFQALRRQVAAAYGLEPYPEGMGYRPIAAGAPGAASGEASEAMTQYINQRVYALHGRKIPADLDHKERRMVELDSYAAAAEGSVRLAGFGVLGTVATLCVGPLSKVIGLAPALATLGATVGWGVTAMEPVLDSKGADLTYKTTDISKLHPAVLGHYRKTCPGPLLALMMQGAGLAGGMTLANGMVAYLRAALTAMGTPAARVDTLATVLGGIFTLGFAGPASGAISSELEKLKISTLGTFLARPDFLKEMEVLQNEQPAASREGMKQRLDRLGASIRKLGGSLGASRQEISDNVLCLTTLAKMLWVAGMFTTQGLIAPQAARLLAGYPPALQQALTQWLVSLAGLVFYGGFPFVGSLGQDDNGPGPQPVALPAGTVALQMEPVTSRPTAIVPTDTPPTDTPPTETDPSSGGPPVAAGSPAGDGPVWTRSSAF